MEKKGGTSIETTTSKANIDILKKEVITLKSLDINILWDSLDMPSGVDKDMAPKGTTSVVPYEETEGVDVLDTLETDEDALGVELCLLDLDKLRMIEEDIIATVNNMSH